MKLSVSLTPSNTPSNTPTNTNSGTPCPTNSPTMTNTPTVSPSSPPPCPEELTLNFYNEDVSDYSGTYYRITTYTGGTFNYGYVDNTLPLRLQFGTSPDGKNYLCYVRTVGATAYTITNYYFTPTSNSLEYVVWKTEGSLVDNQVITNYGLGQNDLTGTTIGGEYILSSGEQGFFGNVLYISYPPICPTSTPTPSVTATNTATPTVTNTNTPTPNITPTQTTTPSITPTKTTTPTPTATPFEVCPNELNISRLSGAWIYPNQNYYRLTNYSGGTFTGGYYYYNGSTTNFIPGATSGGTLYSVFGAQSGSTYYTLVAYTFTLTGYSWRVYESSGDYIINGGSFSSSTVLNTTAVGTTVGGVLFPNPGRTNTGWANVTYPSICPTITPTQTNTATPTRTMNATPTNTSTPTVTPTTTPPCDCVEFINVEVTTAGIITYLDCSGVSQFQNVGIGPEVIGVATCVNKNTLGGTAVFTIDAIGPCCNVVTPTPTPTYTPSPTPFVVDCLTGLIEGSYSGLTQYTYPNQPISSSVDDYIRFDWEVRDRPNRFTVYDSTGLLWTSDWVGQASYTGPWGASLNTAVFGSDYICFQSTSGRYVKVEAGNAAPTPPQLTDAYGYTIVCLGSCTTPTPTPTYTPTPTVNPNAQIDITNGSLDIQINSVYVNGVNTTVIGGVLPNTTGNGTNLSTNQLGTYTVDVNYSTSVAGQHITLTDSDNVSICQNTLTGSNTMTFTGVKVATYQNVSIDAQDGTC